MNTRSDIGHRTGGRMHRALALLAGALLTASALTACAPAADPQPAPATAAGGSITITDPWVKAAPDGMTAAFGTLENPTGEDIVVVSAETGIASSTELHETVADESGKMTMRQVEGGFTIPADGTLDLEPGANHLMLMGLTGPALAGEEVAFTLTFADDSTMSFTAPVKDYSGAKEEYSDHEMPEDGGH